MQRVERFTFSPPELPSKQIRISYKVAAPY